MPVISFWLHLFWIRTIDFNSERCKARVIPCSRSQVYSLCEGLCLGNGCHATDLGSASRRLHGSPEDPTLLKCCRDGVFSLVLLINFECLTGIRGFLTHSNLPVFPFKSTSFGFLDSWGFASNTNVAGRGTHNVKDPDEAGYGGVPQTWQSFWMSNAVVPPWRKCGKPKTNFIQFGLIYCLYNHAHFGFDSNLANNRHW